MRLNDQARAVLRGAGVTQAEWARAQGYAAGRWGGDACGCPDDRCIGYHHEDYEECGCLRSLLADYTRERLYQADERHTADLLGQAQQALTDATDACLLWADDVSRQAERRLGGVGCGEVLDFCGEVQKLRDLAAALAGRFQQFAGDHARSGSA